jgi:hypothetical protein
MAKVINYYKENLVEICDECEKRVTVLWREARSGWLLCPECWELHGNTPRTYIKKEFIMVNDSKTVGGIEPVYSKSYSRRIAIMADGSTQEILDTPRYEFKINAYDTEIPAYIPEKEKPWKERRTNNYKAKRRK